MQIESIYKEKMGKGEAWGGGKIYLCADFPELVLQICILCCVG